MGHCIRRRTRGDASLIGQCRVYHRRVCHLNHVAFRSVITSRRWVSALVVSDCPRRHTVLIGANSSTHQQCHVYKHCFTTITRRRWRAQGRAGDEADLPRTSGLSSIYCASNPKKLCLANTRHLKNLKSALCELPQLPTKWILPIHGCYKCLFVLLINYPTCVVFIALLL